MKNKILHALSNRQGPFNNPIFGQSVDFVPCDYTPEIETLRKKLFLDVTHSDYYLKVYLSVLETYQDLKRQFNEGRTTYRVSGFSPIGVKIEGAQLASIPNMVGTFTDDPPKALPISLTYFLEYVNSTFLRLRTQETGLVRAASYTTFDHGDRVLLKVNWPLEFPFAGPLFLDQAWQPNSQITIQVEPSNFPFQLLVDRLRGEPALTALLRDANLLGQFNGSFEPTEKIALALTTLGLSNTSVYPVEQTLIAPPEFMDAPIVVTRPFSGVNQFFTLGDFGDLVPAAVDVANSLKAMDPLRERTIIHLGDTSYGSSPNLDSFDKRIGVYYSEYLYPYVGTDFNGSDTSGPITNFYGFPVGQQKIKRQRMIGCIGNHDRDDDFPSGVDARLQKYMIYFNQSALNFKYTEGLVDFFSVDGGYDTSNINVAPDGYKVDSKAANWLRTELQKSQNRYKVVLMHFPTYSTSSHRDYPDLRWPYKEWGADLVMHGHGHLYEHSVKDGLSYITNGAGGRQIDTGYRTSANPNTSLVYPYSGPSIYSKTLIVENGFGILTATPDFLKHEWYDKTGKLRDTVVIP